MIQAVHITSFQNAELVSVPPNDTPLAPDEVAGKTITTLISQGTELGLHYRKTVDFPLRPGYAAAWRVERVGSAINDLKPGDIVFSRGEHKSAQRDKRELIAKLPDGLSPDAAVFARMMCVSMATIVSTKAYPPQRVLITGLGPVGHLAAQMFSACGYEVTAVDPQESRRKYLQGVPLAALLPSVPVTDPGFAGSVALVLECSGHEQAALDGCRMIKKGGEVVLVGTPWRKQTEISAWEITQAVFYKFAQLRSGWEYELPDLATEFRRGSIMENFASALKWLANGKVKVDGLYHKVSPADPQKAYQDLLHNRAPSLVTLFDWTML
ncbi:zinc-binding dehydrogenase [soil metagenome]